jgi:hypothetical protein
MPLSSTTTLSDLRTEMANFAAHMEPEFHLPPAEAEPLYADEATFTTEQPDVKRMEQIVAHLQMLGYLDLHEGQNAIALAEIKAAEEAFAGDLALALAEGQIALHFDEAEQKQNAKLSDGERLLRYLKAVATFEGEVALPQWTGEEGRLRTRIVRHRLVCYGLLAPQQSADPFPPANPTEWMRIGCNMFGLQNGDRRELINLLGNAPAATEAFIAAHTGESDSLLGIYHTHKQHLTAADWPSLKGHPGYRIDGTEPGPHHWVRNGDRWELRSDSAHSESALPSFKRIGLKDRHSLPSVATLAQTSANRVGLELLQLRLWMLGYYLGELASPWDELSTSALEQFIKDTPSTVIKDQEDILRIGWGGWMMINLPRILTIIVEHSDNPAEQLGFAELDELAEQTVKEIGEKEWGEISTAYGAVRSHEGMELGTPQLTATTYSRGDNRPARRFRYFGWRKLFAAASAFLHRIGAEIGNKIKAAAKMVIAALKSASRQAFELLRHVWRKARLAMRIARLALRRFYCWLSGTPVFSQQGDHVVATHWSMDFDTCCIVSSGCPAELVAAHATKLDWMSRSGAFMAQVALLVFGLLMKAAEFNWLLLAYNAFTGIRDILKNEDYRRLFSSDLLERPVC